MCLWFFYKSWKKKEKKKRLFLLGLYIVIKFMWLFLIVRFRVRKLFVLLDFFLCMIKLKLLLKSIVIFFDCDEKELK